MDEFGKKAKEGLLQGFQMLRGFAQEKLDLQKLQSQAKVLEQRRDDCLLEVGRRVSVFFEMDKIHSLQDSDWEPIRPRIEEIKDIKRKLQAIEEQVMAVKAGHHSEGGEEGQPHAPTA